MVMVMIVIIHRKGVEWIKGGPTSKVLCSNSA